MKKASTAKYNYLLKNAREQRGWSQNYVAERLQVDVTTVSRWERGLAVPKPYPMQQLCKLYQTTAEVLGFLENPRIEITDHGEQEELSSSPEQALPGQTEAFLRPEKAPFRITRDIRLIVGGALLIIALCTAGIIGTNIYSPRQTSALLYHADWSHGVDGWSLAPDWQRLDREGGIIQTEVASANTIVFAPYSPQTPDYAVEARVKRLGYSGKDGQAYGLIARATATRGYVCGVGAHFLPEHFFLAQFSTDTNGYHALRDFASRSQELDTAWHVYRVEVKQYTMAFFWDGKKIQQISSIAPAPSGQVGIYVDNAAIAIKSFDIYALS